MLPTVILIETDKTNITHNKKISLALVTNPARENITCTHPM
jgi:hypothetical protein